MLCHCQSWYKLYTVYNQSHIRNFIKSLKKKKFHIFGGKGAGGFGMSRQQF